MSSEPPSSERSPVIEAIEAHEEFIQHVERGSNIIRTLSTVTIVVSALLLVGYASQLLFPYLTGETNPTVSLTDPVLQGIEITLSSLTLLWLYIGLRDFLFTRRMMRTIKELRTLERAIEKRMAG